MILKATEIAKKLRQDPGSGGSDPLVIRPQPSIDDLEKSSDASIDLRLGTWFAWIRQNEHSVLEVGDEQGAAEEWKKLEGDAEKVGITKTQLAAIRGRIEKQPIAGEARLLKSHHVSFGSRYILHPGSFVLGVTLEWIRLPHNMAGYVVGKSAWGRRGLIIATAVGVHPGFKGCLTLELSNCGEVPIAIAPGMRICQLFIHEAKSEGAGKNESDFSCSRKPRLGHINMDDVARKLGKGHRI